MTTETLGPTLSASIVGASAGPLTQTIDARWVMAYNAALGDALPRPVAHPLFAVCYEWPVAVALREQAIGAAIAPLSVHATHELVIHRPPRAGDGSLRLAATAPVISALGKGHKRSRHSLVFRNPEDCEMLSFITPALIWPAQIACVTSGGLA